MRTVTLRLLLLPATLLLLHPAAARGGGAAPPHVGTWAAYPRALPALQLPQVPLTGNGVLGAALDAHNAPTPPGALGPGSANAIDVWINSNGFWSCTSCGSTDPDHTEQPNGCCSTAALGGVSFRVTGTFPGASPLPRFSASQALANGALSASLFTAAGGEFRLNLRMHPAARLLSANFTWLPAAGDPPAVEVAAAVWALGKGSLGGSWSTGTPAPWGAGCLNLRSGAREPCAGGGGGPAQAVFASRNASTVDATVMPLSAALAVALWLGPGVEALGAAVANDAPAYPPTLPFEAVARVTVPGGAHGLAFIAQAETRGPGLGDPVPLAWATLASGRGFEVPSAADAWWAGTWAKSAISLPAQPAMEAAWYGSQYILACTSATTSSDDAPAPGLYGVWVSADGPNWHGDYSAWARRAVLSGRARHTTPAS